MSDNRAPLRNVRATIVSLERKTSAKGKDYVTGRYTQANGKTLSFFTSVPALVEKISAAGANATHAFYGVFEQVQNSQAWIFKPLGFQSPKATNQAG